MTPGSPPPLRLVPEQPKREPYQRRAHTRNCVIYGRNGTDACTCPAAPLSASTAQPSRSVARRLERQITRDPQ